jgi:hypothetical protein
MDNPEYYIIESDSEVFAMHKGFGQHYSPDAMCVYFVQQVIGLDTAACYWDGNVSTLAKHKSEDVFVVVTPEAWFYPDVLAHEGGHAFGCLEDIYLLDPPSYECADLKADEPTWWKYLYCDDTAYYDGNLMYGAPADFTADMFTLTTGQSSFAQKFQKDYPDNW